MKKILTVDDSKTIRRIVRNLFEPYLCEVIEAVNGVDGLEKAEAIKPDIILLDVSMPKMDGKELLKKLQNHTDLFTIPVIMLTAEGDKESMFQYIQDGACGFIIKPFEKVYLIQKVTAIIGLEERELSLET